MASAKSFYLDPYDLEKVVKVAENLINSPKVYKVMASTRIFYVEPCDLGKVVTVAEYQTHPSQGTNEIILLCNFHGCSSICTKVMASIGAWMHARTHAQT